MLMRIAMSERWHASPTAVRVSWSFHDFVSAHVMLDTADAARERAEAEGGAHGRR